MTRRVIAAIAAGALAVGVLAGAAGAIVVGDLTRGGELERHHAEMAPMMEMMGGSMMGGFGEMGPNSTQHDAHHPDADR